MNSSSLPMAGPTAPTTLPAAEGTKQPKQPTPLWLQDESSDEEKGPALEPKPETVKAEPEPSLKEEKKLVVEPNPETVKAEPEPSLKEEKKLIVKPESKCGSVKPKEAKQVIAGQKFERKFRQKKTFGCIKMFLDGKDNGILVQKIPVEAFDDFKYAVNMAIGFTKVKTKFEIKFVPQGRK
jgi:hypothetical protein